MRWIGDAWMKTEAVVNCLSATGAAAAAADVACIDPLSGDDLHSLLLQFGTAMSRTRFDDARLLIESFRGTRVPISASAEDSVCHSLLSILSQIVKAESAYYSLNFMVPKAFFRRESTLLLTYTHIKADLCRMDDVIEQNKMSTAEDIRRRLIDFTSARVSVINVYNSFLVENFGLPNELTSLTTVLSSVEDMLTLLVTHESMKSLFTFVANEIVAVKLLLETQLALIRCEWIVNTEISGSQVQHSPLRLCGWIDELYKLLLAKFSLYFHDSLQPQCATVDFDHAINAIKPPNFVQLFATFQRRMDPLFILLIANRFNSPDISPLIGYGSDTDGVDGEGELRKKFLIFLKIGSESKGVNILLPSISVLIQEAATKKPATDRITYCYDQIVSRSFFIVPVEYNLYMAIIFGRRVSERDNTSVHDTHISHSVMKCMYDQYYSSAVFIAGVGCCQCLVVFENGIGTDSSEELACTDGTEKQIGRRSLIFEAAFSLVRDSVEYRISAHCISHERRYRFDWNGLVTVRRGLLVQQGHNAVGALLLVRSLLRQHYFRYRNAALQAPPSPRTISLPCTWPKSSGCY
uniref:Uncharacterized protein n=1 Tax=Setaria digitata TaxID=48799 RepID=A0A915Q3P0_9BILA